MKIELTKAQAKHLQWILSKNAEENQGLLALGSRLIDNRYCRNELKLSNRILTKLFEKGVA
tara:strand:- start:314 stop:496 length:183 start_codon:yes stop_codon:yes gene_type:complete